MLKKENCKACGEPMIFVTAIRKKDGKEATFPLDAEPTGEGTWFISENEESANTGLPMARYVGRYDPDKDKLLAQKLLHTAHHATCPHADQFKGGKR